MQSIGIIVILIGGIIFIVGSIISTSPRHQQFMQQYQAYQIPYQSPFVFQTVNVYFCPDCRNAVEYIDQYQKYYCHNCNDYPFDKTKKKITPPPIEDDEVVDLEFDDQY